MTEQEVIKILDAWWNGKRKQIKTYIDTQLGVSKRTGKAFSPPSESEVQAFILDKILQWKNGYSAQWFIDKYQQAGWKLGNGNPMKDWQATVRLYYAEPCTEARPKRVAYCSKCTHPKDKCIC